MALPTKDQITEKLRAVIDPELRRSIVELGMVRSIEVHDGGRVEVVVSLTTPGCPIRSHFEQAVAKQVSELDGVTAVAVGFDVLSDEEKGNLQQTLGRGKLPQGALAQVKNVICVASGKGGVGKSTMTANLAAALAAEGHPAGALDCDVYGYSIPRMLGVNSKPEVNAERKILPLRRGGRGQGDVDRLLRRGERRGGLARADAAQGDPAVPRGRRLGRAGVPAARPAAGDRRRLDDAGPAPAAGEVRDRHHAAAGGAVGGETQRRDGVQIRPRAARRDREHVRLHHARAASASRSSARAAASSSPTSSTCRCSARCRSPSPCASTPTPAPRWSPPTPTHPPPRRSAKPPAASSPRPPRSCRCCRRSPARPRRRGQRHPAARRAVGGRRLLCSPSGGGYAAVFL